MNTAKCRECFQPRDGCSRCQIKHWKFCSAHVSDFFKPLDGTLYCVACYEKQLCPQCQSGDRVCCGRCRTLTDCCAPCTSLFIGAEKGVQKRTGCFEVVDSDNNVTVSACESCYKATLCSGCNEHNEPHTCPECKQPGCRQCRPLSRIDVSPMTLAPMKGIQGPVVAIARCLQVCNRCLQNHNTEFFQRRAIEQGY